MSEKIFDILVVGSGLSSMTFCEEYLKKTKKIDLISPSFSKKFKKNPKFRPDDRGLPPQFKKNFSKIEDYFRLNKFIFDKKNCSLLGSLEFGGLSNYWGLQIDKDIGTDLNSFGLREKKKIINCFVEILNEKFLLGKYQNYNNNFKINSFYENLINKKEKIKGLTINKSILAIDDIRKKSLKKLVPNLIFNKIKKKLVLHNYFVEKISKKKEYIFLHCINGNRKKIFVTKKLVLATGTLSTTKLIMEYLQIKSEIAIKHHPRLISVYLGRKKISSNLDITPGLFQIKSKTENFSGDIRPCSEMILNMALKIYFFFKPFKKLLMIFKNYIFFSNNLLGSKYSNLFIKKIKNKYNIYSKNKNTLQILKKKQNRIFSFLKDKKIIYPFYKNFFAGTGSDYHYFGTIPVGKKRVSVNKNCQLNNNKSIFIVDGSVLNFKNNLYPLGFVMANAKRIAKMLSK